MLDDAHKKELLEMAASDQLRRDFRHMRKSARGLGLDLDALLSFLTGAGRLAPAARRRRAPAYSRARI
ncbi:MAG: hypothetical protein PHU21_09570 [Elusimicrobia bacterium]|nr:hypothetical protein [Elusimicrobiota bacterium]